MRELLLRIAEHLCYIDTSLLSDREITIADLLVEHGYAEKVPQFEWFEYHLIKQEPEAVPYKPVRVIGRRIVPGQ
jgi:hypothetical protein